MTLTRGITLVATVLALSACEGGSLLKGDKSRDLGTDSKSLSDLKAGIWIDPNGCDHWIIDDGIEGYLDTRYDRYGKPVCSGIAPPSTAVGPFKSGSIIGDPV